MDPLLALLVFAGGVAAGVVNTLAGGGGLLALPLLLFAGVPAPVANGTYRLAVVLQNVAAVTTFRRRGVTVAGEAWPLLVPCWLGAAAGVGVALVLDESVFRRFAGTLLVLMLIPVLRAPSFRPAEGRRLDVRPWMFPAYFAVGFYGGFLQVGIGFVFLALLVGGSGLDLVRANAVKVFLILGYSVLAVVLFIAGGRFSWIPALALAGGNAVGGWLGAHLATGGGERWIRWILVAAVLASALRLWGIW